METTLVGYLNGDSYLVYCVLILNCHHAKRPEKNVNLVNLSNFWCSVWSQEIRLIPWTNPWNPRFCRAASPTSWGDRYNFGTLSSTKRWWFKWVSKYDYWQDKTRQWEVPKQSSKGMLSSKYMIRKDCFGLFYSPFSFNFKCTVTFVVIFNVKMLKARSHLLTKFIF